LYRRLDNFCLLSIRKQVELNIACQRTVHALNVIQNKYTGRIRIFKFKYKKGFDYVTNT